MTVFRLLVYPGNTNLNNLNPPSERAMGYIGFHCISVDKLSFFNTTFTLQCSFQFFLEPKQVSSSQSSKHCQLVGAVKERTIH